MKTYDELKALIEQRGVHELLGPVGEGFNIEQNPHELATFLTRMQALGVQSCLEIGTGYKGGLSRFLAQELGWRVVTVDVQDYGLNYPGVEYWIIKTSQKHDTMRITKMVNRLSSTPTFTDDERFDLVFIDGAHDYASVKSDYETYGKLALYAIAFHDIAGLRDCEGARDFWAEFLMHPNYLSRRYAVIAEEKPAGIGWIELE